MVDLNPLAPSGDVVSGVYKPKAANFLGSVKESSSADIKATERESIAEPTGRELESSAKELEHVVNTVTRGTSLSFRVEEDLSRMVVTVRAVGSDEIIRQFPPEEFLTVAKFIAAQNPDSIDEDFLKGILFDQYC